MNYSEKKTSIGMHVISDSIPEVGFSENIFSLTCQERTIIFEMLEQGVHVYGKPGKI